MKSQKLSKVRSNAKTNLFYVEFLVNRPTFLFLFSKLKTQTSREVKKKLFWSIAKITCTLKSRPNRKSTHMRGHTNQSTIMTQI